MQPLEVGGRKVGPLLGEPIEGSHGSARYAFAAARGRRVACMSDERNAVENKTLITVVAIIALVAIGVAVLTLFLY